ncbi:MAG TPA: DUF1559 domain-containing protein, partial [Isosphaeraceae bacterium]
MTDARTHSAGGTGVVGAGLRSEADDRSTRRWGGRPAFTLIELLVVIGVIGLLAALLLSTIQSAREAARRSQCVANLRQIGIALLNYQSVHDMFPRSFLYLGSTWELNPMTE